MEDNGEDKDGLSVVEVGVPSWKNVEIVPPHVGRKRILLTGAAGFIGHVADYLLARGDEVVVVDEINEYYDVSIKESNLKMLTDKYGAVTWYRYIVVIFAMKSFCCQCLKKNVQSEFVTWRLESA